MALDPDKAVDITLATVALHNMLRKEGRESYIAEGYVDTEADDGSIVEGAWRNNAIHYLEPLAATKSNRASVSAERVREVLADHFYGPGQIPWQWNVLV